MPPPPGTRTGPSSAAPLITFPKEKSVEAPIVGVVEFNEKTGFLDPLKIGEIDENLYPCVIRNKNLKIKNKNKSFSSDYAPLGWKIAVKKAINKIEKRGLI